MANLMRFRGLLILLVLLATSCCSGSSRHPPPETPPEAPSGPLPDAGALARPIPSVAPRPAGGDIISTRLELDLATRRGRALIEVVPTDPEAVSLEAAGLTIESVCDETGPRPYTHEAGVLRVSLPAEVERVRLTIDYRFRRQADYQGEMAGGMVFTWPSFCGNLFPCHSHPTDGLRFELVLTGVPEGRRAIYPESIPDDAPAYMLSWAVGEYTYLDLGRTAAGTQVGVWYLPGHRDDAVEGSVHLRQAFDWLERTYGPYPYGDRVAGVEVSWGPGAYGGMEHHPFWHISPESLDNETVQIHEAAHGWFGNGVRLRCWEDLVLSEGTVSYIAARAVEQVIGPDAAERVWESYEHRLQRAMTRCPILVARPPTCGQVDVLADGLFCSIPYMKGAFFFRAVAGRVGPEQLDRALAAFYRERRGQAASMSDLIETIARETGYDPAACAQGWLGQEAIPDERVCPE